jgi:hypothetical protein
MNTEEIKKLIPSWINSQVETLRKQFDPEIEKEEFETLIKNPKNWKRIIKEKNGENTLRVFDCKPFDDQLRLYVLVNPSGKILSFEFQTE